MYIFNRVRAWSTAEGVLLRMSGSEVRNARPACGAHPNTIFFIEDFYEETCCYPSWRK